MKILVVEDDVFVQEDLKEAISLLGHEVIASCESYEDVVSCLSEGINPDIAFIDIQLSTSYDGTDVAELLRKETKSKVIFLTSRSDDRILHKAKQLEIDGYLVKPFKSDDIKVALSLLTFENTVKQPLKREDIFIRSGHEQIRVKLAEILYAEADDNYVTIYFKEGRKLLTMSLKALEEELPSPPFLRTNRSYLVNTNHVDKVGAGYVMIGFKEIPINETSKQKLKEILDF
jgi:DNA-binding LytR/AlgR family response regulator